MGVKQNLFSKDRNLENKPAFEFPQNWIGKCKKVSKLNFHQFILNRFCGIYSVYISIYYSLSGTQSLYLM